MNARARFHSVPRALALGLAALGLGAVTFAQTPDQQGQGSRSDEHRGDAVIRKKPDPKQGEPTCNCYFSGDCPSGNTCYWGPGGPFTEDHCDWAMPKPSGQIGQGCDDETGLPGGCDGLCQSFLNGSVPGSEEPTLVALAIDLWSLSFLEPASKGGGPVDPEIAEAVFALPFKSRLTPEILGRMVGGIFVIAGGQEFFHPDPALGIPDGHCAPGITLHHVADLTGAEAWRVEALSNLVELLQAEMISDAHTAAVALQRVAACTPDESVAFQPVCGGDDALLCVRTRVHELAISIVTPIPGH